MASGRMTLILCLVLRGAIQILHHFPLAPSTPGTISLPRHSIIWTAAGMPFVLQTKPCHHFHRDTSRISLTKPPPTALCHPRNVCLSSICLTIVVTLTDLGVFPRMPTCSCPKVPPASWIMTKYSGLKL